jgi:hypothetical protein
MAISTVADLNSLFNTIYEDSLFVARETNLMVGLVRNFSATGFMARKIGVRPTLAATTKPEGVDYQNATLFDKQLKATLTPATIMTQVLLTDEQIATDPESARTDASTEMGGAIGTKIDTDLVALFGSLTKEKGAAGAALSIAKCAAAVAVLRTNKAPNPLYFVLHPYGWHDVWTELGQPASQKAFLGDLANEAMRSYFVGGWLSATWFTSANIAVDGSDDAISAVFNPQALGFDSREAPNMETERDASRKAWELNESASYAVGIIRQEYAAKITHDATEPA